MKLMESLQISFISMSIVFAILIILMGVLYLLRFLPGANSEKPVVKSPVVTNTKTGDKSVDFDKLDDDATAAVLAAIIDYSQDTKNQIKVKSVKQI